MKVNRRMIIFSLVGFGILCSLILSISLATALVDNFVDDYIVGGAIIPIHNLELLAPWISVIAILSFLVAAVFWRNRTIR